MNENTPRAAAFVVEAAGVYQEYGKLFPASFDKKITGDNIEFIKQSRYAIGDSIWKIDDKKNSKFLISLLDAVKKIFPEYTGEIEKLSAGLKSPDASKEFILNILQNRSRNITDFIRQQDLTNEFLTFYSLFAAYKYRNSVMDFVKETYDFSSHLSGLCPVCGHWPGISYLLGEKGTRLLSCICCGAQWKFRRIRCSFCLTGEKNLLGYLNIDGEETVSAYTCDNCRRYIKTVKADNDEIDLSGERPIIDYLNSGFVDIAAMQNKYVQDSLLVTKFSGPDDAHLDEYIHLLINE